MNSELKDLIKEAVSEYIDKHLSFTTEVVHTNKETRELNCKINFHFDGSVEDLTNTVKQQLLAAQGL